ncbi:mechanosensitive ion channel family protein [Vineibacter terrae]|uniref:mechanosensitive ion channel family protein n=1 Tax=Vineibacter terrae TaxID=2586908 RepID=UPI002E3030E9|nr:mechanosensitive ion channel family protein [Vineibacter terrae]HEX2888970.1 mechanosensitive ion channel family protein [Vineibacter terrae]
MMTGQIIASVLTFLALLNWRIVRSRPRWVRLASSVGLFALLTVTMAFTLGSPLDPAFSQEAPADRIWQQINGALWWLLAARLIVEVTTDALMSRRFSGEGRLFSDLLAGFIYLTALFTIVGTVFALPIGGLVATSGVIAIVLGLALQNTLADVFAGIAVGIERPYTIGDRVWLDGPIEGEVVQINWRSVQIRTAGNDIATVPNSVVARSRIINRSNPTTRRSDVVHVPCDAAVAPGRAVELIHRAILLCPHILPAPAPSVALIRIGKRSNHYDVAFSVGHSDLLRQTKSTLLAEVLRQFRFVETGAASSSAAREASGAGRGPSSRQGLCDIPLFEALSPEVQAKLEKKLVLRMLEPGQILFSEGDTEASLFIVAAGVLEVSRHTGDSVSSVGRISVGDYIGEIGMLTGVPHAASVTALTASTVFELRKGDVAPLLVEQPELLRILEVSARRGQAILDRSVAASIGKEVVTSGQLLERMRAFFHLHRTERMDAPSR